MEGLIIKGAELFFGVITASFGLCVDRACPGSACDPLTCTFCCCIPTVRGARLRPYSVRPSRGARRLTRTWRAWAYGGTRHGTSRRRGSI
jgi:hypothetical protein